MTILHFGIDRSLLKVACVILYSVVLHYFDLFVIGLYLCVLKKMAVHQYLLSTIHAIFEPHLI